MCEQAQECLSICADLDGLKVEQRIRGLLVELVICTPEQASKANVSGRGSSGETEALVSIL
jgi:hypothetical protein